MAPKQNKKTPTPELPRVIKDQFLSLYLFYALQGHKETKAWNTSKIKSFSDLEHFYRRRVGKIGSEQRYKANEKKLVVLHLNMDH